MSETAAGHGLPAAVRAFPGEAPQPHVDGMGVPLDEGEFDRDVASDPGVPVTLEFVAAQFTPSGLEPGTNPS